MRTVVAAAILILNSACANPDPLNDFLPGATVVSSDPACLNCSIDIQLLSDLAEARDKDAITGHLRSLMPTTDGIMITTEVPGPPLLFAYDGRLSRIIGARTSGPNHFVNASLLRDGLGDSILVLDESARSITLLDLPLNPVRSVYVDNRIRDMAVLGDGSLLVVAPVTQGDSIVPLARVSLSSGEFTPLRSTAIRSLRGADDDYANRVIAPARDGSHFWSAHKLRYAIEKRTLNGEVVQLLERDAEWFRPAKRVAGISADTAPTPRVMGLWEDVRGLIWIHTTTADGRWFSGLSGLQSVDGTAIPFVSGPDLYRDTRIEIVDPENGRLVATAKFDPVFPTFARGAHIARVLEGPMGWLVSEVWMVKLRGFTTR
jgi:hypothetical protein